MTVDDITIVMSDMYVNGVLNLGLVFWRFGLTNTPNIRKQKILKSSILSSEDSSLRVRVTEFETYGIFKIDSSVLNPQL
jgi:hypothetical protein